MNNLQADARNRSLRTLAQSLAFDVLVAVAMVILPIFTSATAWEDINWQLLGFLVFKSVIVSLFSYLMRLRSNALAPPPPPLQPVPEPEPVAEPETPEEGATP